jgi:hypothetical protein
VSGRQLPERSDAGASLIFVLAFVTGVGLIVSALLSFSGTALGGVKSTKYRNDVSYDVDGALKAGISQIRNSQFQDMDPTTCGSYLTSPDGSSSTTVLNFPASNQSGQKVVVTCDGGPNTGLDAENVPVNAANRPGQAVLTLADSGVGFSNSHNGDLLVKGKVRSNSAINSTPGSITVISGDLKAPACSGTVTAQAPGTKDCTAPATWTDPNYVADSGPMTHRTVPPCNSTIVTFSPGLYDDAGALSDRVNTCHTRVFWFQPGVYYFDFRNDAPGASGSSGYLPSLSSSTEWLISNQNVRIVAGKPTFSTTDPPTSLTIPGACVSPLDSTADNSGATFVFGASSRLNLSKGQMEICGQYHKARLPIAIYGAPSTAVSDPHATATVTTPDTAGTNNAGDVTFNNPAGAVTAADSGPATVLSPPPSTAATSAIPAARTASINVAGFDQVIPQYSTLTGASLVVVHRENRQGSKAATSVQVTLTPSLTGTALAAQNVPLNTISTPTGGAFQTDTINVLPILAANVYANGLSGLSAKYAVSTQNNGAIDAYLDQIKLVLEWDPPTLRPIRSTDSTYRDGANPLLYAPNNNLHSLYIMGTTYAPSARLDLMINNAAVEVFRSGIVVWRAAVDINPSATYTGPVIEVPDQTLDYSDVYFTAWLCGSGSPPTTAAAAKSSCSRMGTSRVSFTDDDPANVVAGARQVKVYSWTIYR